MCLQVDDVKTAQSRKKLAIDRELIMALQTWKQSTQFSRPGDWIFGDPFLKAFLRIVERQGRCFAVSRMCPVKHAEKLIVIVRKFHDSYDGCDVLT